MARPITILKVRAEGDSIAVTGFCSESGWQFAVQASDWTSDLLDEAAALRHAYAPECFVLEWRAG